MFFCTTHLLHQLLLIRQLCNLHESSMLYHLIVLRSIPVQLLHLEGNALWTFPMAQASSQLALVLTNIPENVDWGENVDVDINCNRRDWAYALVFLISYIVVIAVVICTIAFIVYIYHCTRLRK